MFTFEMIIAVMLLNGPADASQDLGLVMAVRPQLIALGMAEELLDARESKYFMERDPLGDLITLQSRHKEMENWPRIEEAERFPDRKFAMEACAINRVMLNRLADWRKMDVILDNKIDACIASINMRYKIWDHVRDARCDHYYVYVRRSVLQQLRETIGDEAFYSGYIPAPVP